MSKKEVCVPFRYLLVAMLLMSLLGIHSVCTAIRKCATMEDKINKATGLTRMGSHTAAAGAWQDALDAGAPAVMCLEKKADALYHAKDDAAAGEACTAILSLSRGNARAEYIRGLLCERQGQQSRALEHYATALLRGERLASRRIARMKLTPTAARAKSSGMESSGP